MRILHATPSFAPAFGYGGPIRSLEGLTRGLFGRGVVVRVVTTDANGVGRLAVGNDWQTWQGVPVFYARRWLRPDIAPAFAAHVASEVKRADIVHVTGLFSAPSVAALAIAAASGCPTVLSPRGSLQSHALTEFSGRSKRVWLRAFWPILKRVTMFHATSESEADSIRRVFDFAEVRVVPNGTDLPEFSDRASTRPIVGCIGRIHPVKALERAVEAVAELRSRGVNVELRVAGPVEDAAYYHRIRCLMSQLGLDADRCFVGEVHGNSKWKFYADARVVLLPSHSENFGNVVIEALASGAPVVASKGTPWAELDAVRCGRWVDNTSRSLAGAMEPFLSDATLASEAGCLGRQHVESQYAWTAVSDAMIRVYEDARVAGSPVGRSRRSAGASASLVTKAP